MHRPRRDRTYKNKFYELIEMYGRLCFYCREEISTSIDHIVPVSWIQNDGIDNIVPACALCNNIAGNKHFDDAEHKRQYILKRRASKRNRRCLCADCLLPYEYRVMSPSLFLCAECYDIEYGTDYSKKQAWKKWLVALADADISVAAHQRLRDNLYRLRADDKKAKVEYLIDGYDHENSNRR